MGPSTLFQHKHATRVAGAAFAVVVVTIAAALFDGALVRNGKEAPGQHRRSLQVWDPKTVAPRTQADNYLRQPQESPDSVAASRMQYPETAQMGREQIDYILSVLPPDGNLLVWGLGNDSPYWNSYTSGKVMFLEDDIPHPKYGTLWYDEIMSKYPYLNAFKVHYTTNNDEENFERYMRDPWSDELILEDFPREVLDTAWDVILVDAPQGDRNHGPARYQAIYATLQLARNKLTSPIAGGSAVHVFIDDYERKVENEYSRRAFGGKEPVRVVTRAKGVSNANEQAHFILDRSDCVISDPMSCAGSMQQLPQQVPVQSVPASQIDDVTVEDLMYYYKSDKSRDDHSYVKFYDMIFSPIRHSVTNFTEIGIAAGQSLQAWYRYFPNAELHGYDVRWYSEDVKKNMDALAPRMHSHLVNLLDDKIDPSKYFEPESMDIIIEDSLHTPQTQSKFLVMLWPYLKPGGYFIIEDITVWNKGHAYFHSNPEKLSPEARAIMEAHDTIWVDTAIGHRAWDEWHNRVGKNAKTRTDHNSCIVAIKKRVKPLGPVRMNYGNGAMDPNLIVSEGG